MGNGRWAHLKDAAEALGSTVTAVRKRAKRGGLQLSRDNSGRLLVWIDEISTGGHPGSQGSQMVPDGQLPIVPNGDVGKSAQGAHPGHLTSKPTASQISGEMVPVSVHREAVERLRADMAEAIVAERAETARRISEIQTIHLDLVNRLQAQGALERSLWLERVDAAEVRAERVEQRLNDIVDHLLQRHPDREPWWKRWFGSSSRSEISRG